MTSSAPEAAPSIKRGSKLPDYLRKAGGLFGLDLAELFDDDKEEGGIPEGFAPTFRVTSQLKGRSPGTLTYKGPKTPARTAEFELGPDLRPAQAATQAAPAAAAGGPVTIQNMISPQTPPQLQERKPLEQAPKPDEFATRIAGAYQREFGRAPLQQEVEDWRGTGLGIQEAERQLNVHPFRSFDKAVTDYYNVTMGRAPAQSEIEDWRGTGYSLEKIKSDLMTTAQQQRGGAPAASAPAAAPMSQPAAAPSSDNFAQQVASFYQQSLGRTPAAKEIADWRGTGQDLSQIQSNLALIGARG